MEEEKPSRKRKPIELYVQIVTAASVLIGILLVMVELQQTREMTKTELMTARLGTSIEHNSIVYGETLATTLAKACHRPDELSDAEAIALDAYFQNNMSTIYMFFTGVNIGRGIGGTEDWRRISIGIVNEVLSYPSGKHWIATHPHWSSDEEAKRDEVVAWVQSFKGVAPFASGCDKKRLLSPIV